MHIQGDIYKCEEDNQYYMYLDGGKWAWIDSEIDDTIINIESRYKGTITKGEMIYG